MKNFQDTKMRRLSLPRSVPTTVGYDKQNQLDRVNFMRPSTETATHTPHDSSQPEPQEDLWLLRDHNDSDLSSDVSDDVDISKLTGLFWDLLY